MPVSYTQEQRRVAQETGQHLVTLAAGGLEFSGPTSEEERDRVAAFLLEFLARRREAAKAQKADKPA